MPLALKSDEIPPPPAEAETVFAQAPPDWKNDKEVVFLNKNAGVTLAGTLSLPKGKGSFPALILIPGSGHYFRTITFGPHNLFLFITDNLTKAGFAVLRFDKRGNGSSTGNYDTATTKDFEEDTLSAVKYLSNLPEIDSYKVGLIGHSEGGLIASIAAADSKQTAFIVLMAGPGISPEKRFTLQ
ncbi:MAG TPA: alpha/beta fold hydrolase, partial [bacterium]